MTREAPDLYFDLNSHVLRTRERKRLDQIAPALQEMLRDSPELIIVIEGHCNDWGVHEYNQQLGLERAEAIRRMLLSLSFLEDRVRALGFGDTEPQCLTPDEVCRQKNRCVHFRAAQLTSGAPGGE